MKGKNTPEPTPAEEAMQEFELELIRLSRIETKEEIEKIQNIAIKDFNLDINSQKFPIIFERIKKLNDAQLNYVFTKLSDKNKATLLKGAILGQDASFIKNFKSAVKSAVGEEKFVEYLGDIKDVHSGISSAFRNNTKSVLDAILLDNNSLPKEIIEAALEKGQPNIVKNLFTIVTQEDKDDFIPKHPLDIDPNKKLLDYSSKELAIFAHAILKNPNIPGAEKEKLINELMEKIPEQEIKTFLNYEINKDKLLDLAFSSNVSTKGAVSDNFVRNLKGKGATLSEDPKTPIEILEGMYKSGVYKEFDSSTRKQLFDKTNFTDTIPSNQKIRQKAILEDSDLLDYAFKTSNIRNLTYYKTQTIQLAQMQTEINENSLAIAAIIMEEKPELIQHIYPTTLENIFPKLEQKGMGIFRDKILNRLPKEKNLEKVQIFDKWCKDGYIPSRSEHEEVIKLIKEVKQSTPGIIRKDLEESVLKVLTSEKMSQLSDSEKNVMDFLEKLRRLKDNNKFPINDFKNISFTDLERKLSENFAFVSKKQSKYGFDLPEGVSAGELILSKMKDLGDEKMNAVIEQLNDKAKENLFKEAIKKEDLEFIKAFRFATEADFETKYLGDNINKDKSVVREAFEQGRKELIEAILPESQPFLRQAIELGLSNKNKDVVNMLMDKVLEEKKGPNSVTRHPIQIKGKIRQPLSTNTKNFNPSELASYAHAILKNNEVEVARKEKFILQLTKKLDKEQVKSFLNHEDRDGNNLLNLAIRNSTTELFILRLQEKGAQLNLKAHYRTRPNLFNALYKDNIFTKFPLDSRKTLLKKTILGSNYLILMSQQAVIKDKDLLPSLLSGPDYDRKVIQLLTKYTPLSEKSVGNNTSYKGKSLFPSSDSNSTTPAGESENSYDEKVNKKSLQIAARIIQDHPEQIASINADALKNVFPTLKKSEINQRSLFERKILEHIPLEKNQVIIKIFDQWCKDGYEPSKREYFEVYDLIQQDKKSEYPLDSKFEKDFLKSFKGENPPPKSSLEELLEKKQFNAVARIINSSLVEKDIATDKAEGTRFATAIIEHYPPAVWKEIFNLSAAYDKRMEQNIVSKKFRDGFNKGANILNKIFRKSKHINDDLVRNAFNELNTHVTEVPLSQKDRIQYRKASDKKTQLASLSISKITFAERNAQRRSRRNLRGQGL